MLSTTFFTLTILASGALAQSSSTPSSSASAAVPSGLTPCIMSCVTPAAQAAGCSSFADLSCVCTSSQFQLQASQCIQQNCTAQEVQNALTLQSEECMSVIASGSGSAALPASTGTNASASLPTSAALTSGAQTTSIAPVSALSGVSSNGSSATSSGNATVASSGNSTGTPSSSSPPAQTTNAAMGSVKGDWIGIVGLFVGLLGLAL